jgi:hypothetical protein
LHTYHSHVILISFWNFLIFQIYMVLSASQGVDPHMFHLFRVLKY